MGLFKPFRGSSLLRTASVTPTTVIKPNPNPYRFQILRYFECGIYTVAEVLYPDCTTFEGRKILVFRNISLKRLRSLKYLDPHLICGSDAPFARFIATSDGWEQAVQFARVFGPVE